MAGGGPDVDYVYGLDAGFLMPTCVSIASLDRFIGPDDRVVALHVGLKSSEVATLGSCVTAAGFDAHECSSLIDMSWPVPDLITSAAYARNVAADVLTSGRCLYLDGDTLVRRDPAPLAGTDLGGCTAGAVRSRVAPFLASPGGVVGWFESGLRGGAPHFNSGVMVLDLDRWRQRDVNRAVGRYLREHGERAVIPDQEALNAALVDDWLPLDRTWNYITHVAHSVLAAPEDEPTDPAIVHFAGREKPWSFGPKPMYAEEWYELLAATPFAGFRPTMPPPPRGLRAGARRGVASVLRRARRLMQDPS